VKIGLIGALDCEITEFCRDFNAVKSKFKDIFVGSFKGHEIYICLCGVGKVNAAACTQRLCDLTNVDCIINSGVAGAVTRNLGVCDIAVSSLLTYHDFYPIEVLDKYEPHCSVFKADDKLLKLACDACSELGKTEKNFRYDTGMIVSGDKFVEDSSYVKQLSAKYGALCTEMEGAAIAHVAYLNKTPFIVIRAISDNADENADMSFEQMSAIAAKRAGFVVTSMISAL